MLCISMLLHTWPRPHASLSPLQCDCSQLFSSSRQSRRSRRSPRAGRGDISSVIDALFGSVSSRQAFARQRVAEEETTERFVSTRHKALTYGEFDLDFFLDLLDDAAPQPGERFCDIGSGCGRLVLAAAMANDWAGTAGVEVLEQLHARAINAHTKLSSMLADEPGLAPLAPCRFVCAEADEAMPHLLHNGAQSHVVFCFATCWPGTGPVLPGLSETLATSGMPVGSRVITIDKQLVEAEPQRWRFELLSTREAPNYATHASIGYVYRLAWTADDSVHDGGGDSGDGGRSGASARGGRSVAMCAATAGDDDDDAEEDGELSVASPVVIDKAGSPVSLARGMEALGDAAAAQAEAAEALGEGWEELDQMERKLADELGLSVEELEAFLDAEYAEEEDDE